MSDKNKDEDKFNKKVDENTGPYEYVVQKAAEGQGKLRRAGITLGEVLLEDETMRQAVLAVSIADGIMRQAVALPVAKALDEKLRKEDKTMYDELLSEYKTLDERLQKWIKEIQKIRLEDTDVNLTIPGTNITVATVKLLGVVRESKRAEEKFNSKVDKTGKVKKQNNKMSYIARQKASKCR